MNDKRFTIHIENRGRSLVGVRDFQVEPGTITFLFGESGIGKSMITKAIYGLLDPARLSVTVNKRNYAEYLRLPWTKELQANSFFVFQEPSSHLNPLMRLTEQLNEGSLAGVGSEREILAQLWDSVPEATVRRILNVFPKPYRPSGGEKQRLLLAMAFKKIISFQGRSAPDDPNFFVFDEPTGSLDNAYRNRFLQLLFDTFGKKPITAMVITHDYSIISELYRRHEKHLRSVRFKELVRDGESMVRVSEFSPDDYLGWLHSAEGIQDAGKHESPVVLRVAPEFSVFGRHLRIYSDKAKSKLSSLVVRKGQMVYVKAPSGVGKTTLAKVVMGLYAAEHLDMEIVGSTMTHGTPLRKWQTGVWGKSAGMVFQHADEALDLEATVKETFDGLPLGGKDPDAVVAAGLRELFGNTDNGFLKKKVKYLSGGQKQRLNLLRTLILRTDLVILDEPLNALDFESIKKVLAILERRRQEGAALLMISHNEEIFDHLIDPTNVYYLAER